MKGYSIGQVARLLGVKPHILRYWEGELPLLAPRKGLSGRREYTASEVELLMRFQRLVRDRKFTVEGAKRRLWEELARAVPDSAVRISEIRGDLIDLLMTIRGKRGDEMSEASVLERFTSLGQGHLFADWGRRPAGLRKRLLDDLDTLEASALGDLVRRLSEGPAVPPTITPAPYISLAQSDADGEARGIGEQAIREGRTALLTVAGGQGSRLGFDGPKGMFPITPVRKASLFQVTAEKILAAARTYGASSPWLIMTSPQNHQATREYFETQGFFGLPRDEVFFFTQGVLPSLDPSGRLLLAPEGGLLYNPNGHGGVVEALRASGLLEKLACRGVEEIFYFQVDNPLVTVPDPVFLGFHRRARSQVSSKVVRKAYPEEKLGVICLADERPSVVEYSDAPAQLMSARDAAGALVYAQGSIAIHILNVDFLSRPNLTLPYHQARKRVRTLIPGASATEIEEREAVKFEMFIFDTIPLAERALFFEVRRADEFAPLKNSEGVDSIQTCLRGQTEKHAAWLEACGVTVPRGPDGLSLHAVEISPLFAADPRALAARRASLMDSLDGDTLLA
jgi:UDP-N-acetylglucosamine/UDP-N-acetylgalactosamine diphosphorylase